MASQTVSDLILDRLTQWGVDTVFGLPGDGINARPRTGPLRP